MHTGVLLGKLNDFSSQLEANVCTTIFFLKKVVQNGFQAFFFGRLWGGGVRDCGHLPVLSHAGMTRTRGRGCLAKRGGGPGLTLSTNFYCCPPGVVSKYVQQ